MLRSEIDGLIDEAQALFAAQGLALPPWARFSPTDWAARPEQARFCAERQMGWDVTDFGSGDFAARGLLLLCTRNGIQGRTGERPYAEKLMVVRDGQETPFHRHIVKAEDIINRGGGDLVVEVTQFDGTVETTVPVSVTVDGDRRRLPPRSPVVLAPGESITLVPGQMHRFYGRGIVVVGEVSQTNDDHNDNVFLEPVGRFAAILNDAPARFPLWSELV
ncbi:D-lyxose/D-mannose family sugar isomerase [Lichenibacterium ramalinae]|uniref:D-lyxose ketol-isomerase n=1 Tax=Lichenibacterium ramalinae TaxID=2316527 RepID=A0A4Q2RG73_9HYPH|nr:D-lyxose/D-mannose family sugar isomerase [Lichenibacterium ramalinae]RYB07207.1 D-lyxose/D-mannose family sugar isomerase [Lichenibacterium ramalinae]